MTTANDFEALLNESVGGTVMGIRIGDTLDSVRRRLGPPDSEGRVGKFVVYGIVELSIGDEDEIQMIYAEVPCGMTLHSPLAIEQSSWRPSPDPDVLTADIGKTHLVMDRSTGALLSFAVW
jgi:hypothetical protein